MNKSLIANVGKVGALLLWAIAIYLFFSTNNWYLLAAIILLHLVELPLAGYKAGTTAGNSPLYTVFMTLIFGFTWWKYLD